MSAANTQQHQSLSSSTLSIPASAASASSTVCSSPAEKQGRKKRQRVSAGSSTPKAVYEHHPSPTVELISAQALPQEQRDKLILLRNQLQALLIDREKKSAAVKALLSHQSNQSSPTIPRSMAYSAKISIGDEETDAIFQKIQRKAEQEILSTMITARKNQLAIIAKKIETFITSSTESAIAATAASDTTMTEAQSPIPGGPVQPAYEIPPEFIALAPPGTNLQQDHVALSASSFQSPQWDKAIKEMVTQVLQAHVSHMREHTISQAVHQANLLTAKEQLMRNPVQSQAQLMDTKIKPLQAEIKELKEEIQRLRVHAPSSKGQSATATIASKQQQHTPRKQSVNNKAEAKTMAASSSHVKQPAQQSGSNSSKKGNSSGSSSKQGSQKPKHKHKQKQRKAKSEADQGTSKPGLSK